MKMINKLGLYSIIMTFFFAAIGMLLQLSVEAQAGSFFDKVKASEYIWNLSHVILLFSVTTMLPAGISLRSMVKGKKSEAIASTALILLAPTSIFLAGQYAIDFIAPISANIAGDAIKAYNSIDQSMPASILFYGLSNLSILMLMIITFALLANSSIDKRFKYILYINWLFVLLGNLIDPLFQRLMILLLSLSYIPLIKIELSLLKKKIPLT